MSKFGLYDHALKAWLHRGFDTVEEAAKKLVETDVKTAVVAPDDGKSPSPASNDGAPAAPQEEVAVVTAAAPAKAPAAPAPEPAVAAPDVAAANVVA